MSSNFVTDYSRSLAPPERRGRQSRFVSPVRLWVLLLTSLSLYCAGAPTTVAGERDFWITPDPGFVLIDLEFPGAQTPTSSIYTLFADGRLVVKRQGIDGTVFRQTEHQIPPEDVTSLLEDLVNSGLMEYDKERIEASMGPKWRTFHISDDGGMRLFLGLQRYRAPGAEEAKLAEVEINLSRSPRFVAHHFPEVEEIQCLSRMAKWFYNYRIGPRRAP